VGATTFRTLTARFGSGASAWDATDSSHKIEALDAADRALESLAFLSARLLTLEDAGYPSSLLDLADPPPCLFARGNLELLHRPIVAIVGTRGSTLYGERVTREIAAALARSGATILSGLARGIDGVAHRAALDAGGGTAGVLGTGIDVAYPRSHVELHERMTRDGLLLSEELPGEAATGGSFPKRNRIIAALARATIVVEAPARSGALITASQALSLGRAVAAVPGPIDSPHSAGSNALLRDGAIVVTDVPDALVLAGLSPPSARPPMLDTSAELGVWRALGQGPLNLDALAARTSLPARDCLAAVTALELRGAVECTLTGEVRRRL